jgi:hypothetical protein
MTRIATWFLRRSLMSAKYIGEWWLILLWKWLRTRFRKQSIFLSCVLLKRYEEIMGRALPKLSFLFQN